MYKYVPLDEEEVVVRRDFDKSVYWETACSTYYDKHYRILGVRITWSWPIKLIISRHSQVMSNLGISYVLKMM